MPYPREELGHADNSFTLFQNEPPYVLSSELAQLPAPFGHSDGDGLARNKRYIVRFFPAPLSFKRLTFESSEINSNKVWCT